MSGLGGAFLLIVLLLLATLSGQYNETDVRAVCADHRGVAQVETTTWVNFRGSAAVVCRDGSVGAIRDGDVVPAR